MWSPIWSVGSIEPDGILNACTTKVRMTSARSSATPSASAYSRSCDLLPRHRARAAAAAVAAPGLEAQPWRRIIDEGAVTRHP